MIDEYHSPQQGTNRGHHGHVKAHEFIFDVLSSWETPERSSPIHSCTKFNFIALNLLYVKLFSSSSPV